MNGENGEEEGEEGVSQMNDTVRGRQKRARNDTRIDGDHVSMRGRMLGEMVSRGATGD